MSAVRRLMRLPSWTRVRRTRQTSPRTVTVDLSIDVTRFVEQMSRTGVTIAAMTRHLGSSTQEAREADEVLARTAAAMGVRFAEVRYRRRIEHQRSLGQAYVGGLLDGLCRDFGLDPVTVWRRPRALEEADRLFRLEAMRFAYFGLTTTSGNQMLKDVTS